MNGNFLRKARRCIFATILLFGIYSAAKLFLYSQRNYEGFCHGSDFRLNDQAKIDRAIEHFFRFYPKNEEELTRFLKFEGMRGLKIQPGNVPIPYKGVPEFKSVNENCCRVLSQPEDMEASRATLLDRITGSVSSFVQINYTLRYIDTHGIDHSQKAQTHYAINNCGLVWNKN